MKTPEMSRFGKLVAYLLDPQGKKTRVFGISKGQSGAEKWELL